jgi:hypothetical protein
METHWKKYWQISFEDLKKKSKIGQDFADMKV